ncbi:MAG: hypothetical protein ACI4ET_07470 [Bilifractor sp.]
MQSAIDENARKALNQKEYEERFTALEDRYAKAEKAYKEMEAEIQEKVARSRELVQLIKKLKGQNRPIAGFDPALWGAFIERIIVHQVGITMVMKDGTKIDI